MATKIPSEVMHLESEVGRIAKGYRADIIALDIKEYSCRVIDKQIYSKI